MLPSSLVALMLGRLRMSVEDAIACYGALAKTVFGDVKRFGDGKFKASNLENAIKDIVKKQTGQEDERMMDSRPNGECCKT